MSWSLFQLGFGPKAFGVEFEGAGDGFACFGVVAGFAEGDAAPEVGFGEFGVEGDGFVEIGDSFVETAAEGGRQVVVADAAGEEVGGGVGVELDGFGDFVEGAAAIFEAGEDIGGDDLAAESAEDAVEVGVIGLGGDGFAGGVHAGFGGGGAGFFVAFFHGDFGLVAVGEGELVEGRRGGSGGEFGDLGGEGGGVLAVAGVFEGAGGEGEAEEQRKHPLYFSGGRADGGRRREDKQDLR